MPIYRTFQYIEEYIVSNRHIEYLDILKTSDFFVFFRRKFRKFPENSENPWTKVLNNNNNVENSKKSLKIPKILKIRRKFLKKKVFFEALILYRYRIVSRKKTSYRIDIVSSPKKAYRSGVNLTDGKKN